MLSLKHAFRQLIKSPGFTFTALATLAICLGANLTIFAVVDSILIRSLPYPDGDRLVTIYHSYPKAGMLRSNASITSYYERRGKLPALASLAAISQTTSVVGETGTTSIQPVGRVTPEFFATLGVAPLMGRVFTEAELTYQTDQEAIISYEYWRSHFNSDPAVLGKTLRRDGMNARIVSVLPPNFRFLSFTAPIYTPLSSEEGERNIPARHNNGPIQIARLAPGATLADAQAQLDAFDAAHAAEFPEAKLVADAGYHATVAPLHADHVASIRPVLLLLQGGALLLFVIGGVNLVNLLLIRASSRSRELAIRQALGASQGDVVREVLTETMLLTGVGALLGLAVGAAGIKLLATLGADQLPLGAQIVFDARLAILATIVAVITGAILGLPIVWFNLRSRLGAALQSESRGGTVNRATQRLRHGFIIAQIALAFVLLSGAGLLGLSLQRAMAVAPGFRTDHVITGRFNLTWSAYHDDTTFHTFFDRLIEKGRGLPGVVALGAASNVPVSGTTDGNAMSIPGFTSKPGDSLTVHNQVAVAGDYFAAMGIPLREGRYLTQADVPFDQRNCVVDELFAHRYWPNESAIGKHVYRGSTPGPNEGTFTIVGVVGTVKQEGLTEKSATGSVYFTFTELFKRNYYLAARTSLPPEALAATLAKMIREIDPDMPLTDLRSMEVRIDDNLVARRSPALLAVIFALTALLLATIGLYGVMAYTVSQRTSEFGIRMALGAQRGDVLRMVFGQGARLSLLGLVVGVAGALLLTDTMSSLLFDVQANDPRALAGVAGLLAVVAALACYLPARRATKVDPMVALRNE